MHNILFIYPNQFGYHTDSYKYCEHLQYKYKISYICFDQGYEKLDLPNVKIYYMPYNIGKLKRLINYYKFIIKLTRKENIDILFTVQFKLSFLIGLFAKSKVKILDYRTGDLNPNDKKRYINNIFMWSDSLFFKNITVISEGLREILNFNKEKTLILPLGADIISSHPHTYNRIDLLYVGAFNSRNIYQTIIGLAKFLEIYPDFKSSVSYTLIGFGNKLEEDRIRDLIIKYQLSTIVSFLGRKKYTDLKTYFDTCNIGISYVPKTPYYEHQPVTKTFEYALSGLYTIATDTIENRKVINETNGVLCDDTPEGFANALEKVYKQRENIQENSLRCSLLNCQWSIIVSDILEPYLLKKLNENISSK